ncbi:hypothetical protein JB92DRAFT_3094221 [Gautieria morchelliformis]|nr:hypothetical protein JB92DRAFT_3094221 [Gautieria morchelliformis]
MGRRGKRGCGRDGKNRDGKNYLKAGHCRNTGHLFNCTLELVINVRLSNLEPRRILTGADPSNAFSSLIIDGLTKINGVQVPSTLSKTISKPAKPVLATVEANATVGGLPPVRPPSKLPPAGNLCLQVSLEPERLGYGRVGSVYPLRIDNTNQCALPSLVIKVAARRRSDDLAREAWFYEEMEDIQGVAVARCYGFFTAEIEQNSEVLDWAASDADYDEEEVDVRDEASQSEDDEDLGDTWNLYAWTESDDLVMEEFSWEVVLKRFDERQKLRQEREAKRDRIIKSTRANPASVRNGSEKTFLSVLVLERLGDVMPIGVPLEALKPDVREIYSDMGRFGIEHMDIRWRNILAAPATDQSIVCPYHGHKHQWRVVDFDRSRKSNFSHSHIESSADGWLRTMLDGLEEGYVVEPWD